MKNIFLFVLTVITGKFIEDNLPSLRYKHIIKGLEKNFIPLLLFGYIGFLYIVAKTTRNPELRKNYQHVLLIIGAGLIMQKVIKQHQQQKIEGHL